MHQSQERGSPVSFVDLLKAAHTKKADGTVSRRAQRQLQEVEQKLSQEAESRAQSATPDTESESTGADLSTEDVNKLYLEV